MAWWELEAPADLEYPGLDDESRVLYEHGFLTPAERAQFESEHAPRPE
jgi:hypothetical protein